MSESTLDKKKVIIMLAPIIISGMLYLLFFNKKEDVSIEKNKKAFVVPDSEAEKVPSSKTEVYKKALEREKRQRKEKEDSYISSEYFYNLGGGKEESSREKIHLNKKESIEKLSKLLPDDNVHAGTSPKKWETKVVDDPLEPYKDFSGNTRKKKISKKKDTDTISRLPEENTRPTNIYGKRSRNNAISPRKNGETTGLISAAIHNDQTISNGSTVKMRLQQDIYINGKKIPENSFIYGIARFSNERVIINLTNVRLEKNIYPFSKSVIDQDGIEGLFFPVNLKNQMGTEMSNESIDEIYGKATARSGVIGDVISASKSVLKRKNSEKKVTLKANYKIYLK